MSGILFVAIFAAAATYIADLGPVKALGLSPLVIGIVMGIFYANTLHNQTPVEWHSGITFSGKKILRFAIVVYGFRITFQQIADVGMDGFLVSLIMLTTTMIIGSWAGTKLFGMDKDTSILTAAGGAVCGAAAVLATEPVLKAEDYKTAVAVSMVVLFGTISMFLYPALYNAGLIPFDEFSMGIYTGGTVHEVAHVVGAGNAIGQIASDNAIIVKMTRVLLLLPMLLGTGWFLNRQTESGSRSKLPVPWFAVAFMGVVIFHSFVELPSILMQGIHTIDTLFLTMAMTALGLGTTWEKVKKAGPAPLLVAGIMFAWLMVGGFFITASSLSFCIENCPVTH